MTRWTFLALLSFAALTSIGTAVRAHDWVGLLVILSVIVFCERALYVRRRRR